MYPETAYKCKLQLLSYKCKVGLNAHVFFTYAKFNISAAVSIYAVLLPSLSVTFLTAGLKYRSQVTGYLSQVIVLPIQKVSQTLVKANLRPKNFCLGLIRPKVSFYN